MGLFKKVKDKTNGLVAAYINQYGSSTDSSDAKYREETFFVAGGHYYKKNINNLACSNPDYRYGAKRNIKDGLVMRKIFRYTYLNKPVKLIPEPNNEHDKNAVMVLIAGEKVGYIRAEEALHVKHILSTCDIKFISSFLSGGDYKVVSLNGDVEKLTSEVSIRIRIGYVG